MQYMFKAFYIKCKNITVSIEYGERKYKIIITKIEFSLKHYIKILARDIEGIE